jgi:hypothetical protein
MRSCLHAWPWKQSIFSGVNTSASAPEAVGIHTLIFAALHTRYARDVQDNIGARRVSYLWRRRAK